MSAIRKDEHANNERDPTHTCVIDPAGVHHAGLRAGRNLEGRHKRLLLLLLAVGGRITRIKGARAEWGDEAVL